uniref:Splicing factor PRP8 n=1 Tax=Lotharella vacuolata TaxID=74820 RepID=A0A0H5BKB8_9EUKA|nr:splicing factor PRP8 [Lotharella vacuolata]
MKIVIFTVEVSNEYVRNTIKYNFNLLKNKKIDKNILISSLKYLPHAIYKLLENIPMPWVKKNFINILHHVSGSLSFVNEIPKVIEKIYFAQWGIMWKNMKKEKKNRKHFSRMKLPPFDDEEKPIDFVDNLMNTEPLAPIKLVLSKFSNAKRLNFIFSLFNHKEDEIQKKYYFKIQTLNFLENFANILLSNIINKNYYFLFNFGSFFLSKTLNLTITGGPRFDINKKNIFKNFKSEHKEASRVTDFVLFNYPIRTEYRIAYPYLYNSDVKNLNDSPYIYDNCVYIKSADKDVQGFFLDPCLHKLRNILKKYQNNEDLKLKKNFKILFEELFLYNKNTLHAINLMWASNPFDNRNVNKKRILDISFSNSWFSEHCPVEFPIKVRISHQKLLKRYVLNKIKNSNKKHNLKTRLLDMLINSEYFRTTKIEWIETGVHLNIQGFNMLNLLIHKKGLNFLHLDYNFNLKPIKTLTTKERKKSRFGNAFHLCREIMRMTKLILDSHIQYRLGNIDAYQLADGIQFIFTHIGQLTGMYRYKYKLMKQIRICKDLKHLIYYRFNTSDIGKGPGVGFWIPTWRVWLYFLRGITPLLENWINNLLVRQFIGRTKHKIAKSLSKQRIESHFDLELRTSVINEISSLFPSSLKENKINLVLQHLSEAWRCWKANIPWLIPGMNKQIEIIIHKYVKLKADWWSNIAYYNRERIKEGATVDKTVCRKNIGRLTRLFIKSEHRKQIEYSNRGPFIKKKEIIGYYTTISEWFRFLEKDKINFPNLNDKFSSNLLTVTLNHLKEQFSANVKLNLYQKEEMELIEYAYNNSNEVLKTIKRYLLIKRAFKEVFLSFMDHFDNIIPIYEIDAVEKLVDAYLDHFLWFENNITGVIPDWVKPSDKEILPHLVYNWCKQYSEHIKLIKESIFKKKEKIILFKSKIKNLHSKIDFFFLNKLLKIFIDFNIVDYITSRNNVYISYKDMNYLNKFGIIRGIQFSGFLIQYIGLLLDFSLIGIEKARDLRTETLYGSLSTKKPVLSYIRIYDTIYILLKLNKMFSKNILFNFYNAVISGRITEEHPLNKYIEINDKTSVFDMTLSKAIFWEFKKRIPSTLFTFETYDTKMFYYIHRKEKIIFEMCNFIFIVNTSGGFVSSENMNKEGIWKFFNPKDSSYCVIIELTLHEKAIKYFENRIRQILMSSGSTTFTKIANRWNLSLIGFVTFFREAIGNSQKTIETIIKCENKIQTRIKMGLNSKMPSRFPPVVFYSPKEMGGLGLISMSYVMIPASDMRYSTLEENSITHFFTGLNNDSRQIIPNLYRYLYSWDSEFKESRFIWSEYSIKKKEAKEQKKKLTIKDIEIFWNKGIPRINTLFQKNRYILEYEKGWRLRSEFKKFYLPKHNPFWWTNQKHDGKLWNLVNYRTDIINSLGGVRGILEHTLFKGTYFPNWEGLFWEKASGFEETMRFRKLTNAQRSGLNQIPNRRFTLWWSPTINRANVYVGFQVQLDLTGIFMHGKIPTLKISLIQIFRAHLWQKIHEGIVLDYCRLLENHLEALKIELLQKESIHPRKSYKMNSSCADILLFSKDKWLLSTPSLLTDRIEKFNKESSSKFWLDIQLRWGDYDSHDIERYVKTKFNDYVCDLSSIYPSSTGVMVGFDLCYNIYSAYGNWLPGLKIIMIQATSKICSTNSALFTLRERIRKGLQLFSADPIQTSLSTSNRGELFSSSTTWILDDTNVYRVTIHKTAEGNFATKPINGCILIMNPKNGQLILKVIHYSVWEGHKRLGQFAKWKCAEEVCKLLNKIPTEEHPKKIVVTRKILLDPLIGHLVSFSNIAIVGTDLLFPFQSLLKIKKINDIVLKSQNSKLVIINLYDDWLKTISSYTAFSRLIIILKAMHINYKKVIQSLNIIQENSRDNRNFWNKFDIDDWISFENIMIKMITKEYFTKNNIKNFELTKTELNDILFGLDISLKHKQVKKNIQKNLNDEEKLADTTKFVITKNKKNQTIISSTKTPYENVKYVSEYNWRDFFFQYHDIELNKIKVLMSYKNKIERCNLTYIICLNLIKKIIESTSLSEGLFGLMYGKDSKTKKNNKKIKSFVIPAQIGLKNLHQKSFKIFDIKMVSELVFLGWINTTKKINKNNMKEYLILHSKILFLQKNWESSEIVFIIFEISVTSCLISGFRLNVTGFEWIINNNFKILSENIIKKYYEPIRLIITKKQNSYYYIPKKGIWNYYFLRDLWVLITNFEYKIGNPIEYYNEFHRPFHFINYYSKNANKSFVEI